MENVPPACKLTILLGTRRKKDTSLLPALEAHATKPEQPASPAQASGWLSEGAAPWVSNCQ